MENEQPIQQLNNREQYEQKRQQKVAEQALTTQKKMTKKILKIALVVLFVGGGMGLLIWYLASAPPVPEGEIISRAGIHWHPEVAIFAKGEKQTIPANIGIGAIHQPMHTHDSSGVIHLEFQGLVRKDDLKLGRLFEIWGKDFMEFGSLVSMTVNGEENTELQNYQMKDGDTIELHYQ